MCECGCICALMSVCTCVIHMRVCMYFARMCVKVGDGWWRARILVGYRQAAFLVKIMYDCLCKVDIRFMFDSWRHSTASSLSFKSYLQPFLLLSLLDPSRFVPTDSLVDLITPKACELALYCEIMLFAADASPVVAAADVAANRLHRLDFWLHPSFFIPTTTQA